LPVLIDERVDNSRGPSFGIARHWFVPKDLTFKHDGGLLVLAAGHMRLRTEVMSGNLRGTTTPADEYFADFVTRNYDRLSEKFPVYGD
jgi:hypothetical protein